MNIDRIINNVYRLPSASKDILLNHISENTYPCGFLLFRENIRGAKAYFIKKGIVRAFAYHNDKEVTFWFGKEGDIVFPLQTLYSDSGEHGNVELLEERSLYEIGIDKLQELFQNDIHLANWGRKYMEYACIRSEKQFIARQFKTSTERYRELIGEYPDITQRIPLGIIASYLGISQVSLSRIRARRK